MKTARLSASLGFEHVRVITIENTLHVDPQLLVLKSDLFLAHVPAVGLSIAFITDMLDDLGRESSSYTTAISPRSCFWRSSSWTLYTLNVSDESSLVLCPKSISYSFLLT